MSRSQLVSLFALSLAACSSPASNQSSALVAPALGSSESFAVLAGSTVTNTGPSTLAGNLGVSPGTAITGFPPGLLVGGATHAADAVALQAQTDVAAAYGELAAQACNFDLTGQDLGGLTLVPGVYCFSSSAQLTGALALDAGGRADAVFVFQIASTLTTASNASVRVINGGVPCNVFWQIGSSATLGTGTAFAGSILALTSITLTTDAAVTGRALARNGAVTLDSNRVSAGACAVLPIADGGTPAADAAIAVRDLAAMPIDAAAAIPVDAAAAPAPDLAAPDRDLAVCGAADLALATLPDLSCKL